MVGSAQLRTHMRDKRNQLYRVSALELTYCNYSGKMVSSAHLLITRATSATSSTGLPALELTYCNYSSKTASSARLPTHTLDKRTQLYLLTATTAATG